MRPFARRKLQVDSPVVTDPESECTLHGARGLRSTDLPLHVSCAVRAKGDGIGCHGADLVSVEAGTSLDHY